MASITENYTPGDWLKFDEGDFSRASGTLASGNDLVSGAVLGQITNSTPTTGTADGGNTGNGTMTGVTAGDQVAIGTYTMTCTAAAADAGTFAVMAPDGSALPDAEVGTAYVNEQINFTINDGATDFAVGDIFTVAVAAGNLKYTELDLTAVDGSQHAAGLLFNAIDATSADLACAVVVRDAIINSADLTWFSGATAGQKTAALAELAELGIIEATAA